MSRGKKKQEEEIEQSKGNIQTDPRGRLCQMNVVSEFNRAT